MAIRTLFVGAGAMGGAILKGALAQGLLLPQEVYVKEHHQETCERLHQDLGVQAGVTYPNMDTVELIVFAVKPQVLPLVLDELGSISADTHLVSIAAGTSLATLREKVASAHWYRAMPNTPVAVGAGLTAITDGQEGGTVPPFICKIFESIGAVLLVTEENLDRLGAVCGTGPGFLYVLMDAMADAAVRIGLPRQVAIEAVAQTFYGAGLLAVKSKMHPAVLRDQVTSPGGTTIAGIAAMEAAGARTAMQAAVTASYARSNELGKKK